ncbi:MAG TPA: pectin acetylesterase-family hydrolase [Actinomycetota bacterium]|nr:pectin acetylesterase-family hydrolase [Actinomycetota bacterium]
MTPVRWRIVAAVVGVALAALGCVGDRAAGRRPAPESPADGVSPAASWERIEPGGQTRCARGGTYAFWVRRGSPDRLLVYFQGGGACFDPRTCAPGSPFFDDSVGPGDAPGRASGILDLDDPWNPFRGHTIVFIPSCTGDVHWGDARTTYGSGPGRVTIEHRGFVNASAALEWAYRNVLHPSSVMVAGCSAGSVGSAAHVPFVIERYAAARIGQLGDSLAFVFDRPIDLDEGYRVGANLPEWVRGLVDPERFRMADWYEELARRFPDVAFAQFNYARDRVQRLFYRAIGGRAGEFPSALRRSLRAVRRATPNVHTYTAPGDEHCILGEAGFFTLEVEGVSLRRWVADLAAGRRVPDVGRR